MITKEEFEKAVECCASDITDCDGCPLCASDKQRVCSTYLAEYITKKSLHLRQQVQAQRKKKTLFKLMIAQNRIYVKCSQVLCQPF